MRDKGNETDNAGIQNYDFMTLESRKQESILVCGCHLPIFALISVNSGHVVRPVNYFPSAHSI